MTPINNPSTILNDELMQQFIIQNNATTVTATSTITITSAMLQQHNLQALVELQYIRVGNEVMNSALNSLDTALSLTQAALTQLSSVQNLHNQIKVTANSTFPLNFSFTGCQTLTLTSQNTALSQSQSYLYTVHNQASFVSAYQKLASVYYGKPLTPNFFVSIPKQSEATKYTPAHPAFSTMIVSGNEPAYKIFVDMMKSAKAGLESLMHSLSAITNPNDPNTLLAQLKPVIDNFPTLTNFASVKSWAIDNYGGSTAASITAAGQFQQQISTAITAAQSTNTTQQEAVRRYMFVFEQYMQSAAAILKALDTLFQSISRNISSA